MQASKEVEAPPVTEWQRREQDRMTLERIARRGSIKGARRPGVLGWLKARLGLR